MRVLKISLLLAGGILFLVSQRVNAQESPITEIPFETVPENTTLQGTGGIILDSNVLVSQDLMVDGSVQVASGGYEFPDGSLQTTAAVQVIGGSANAGLYDNRIVEMVPPLPFSEICIKNGQVFGDIHVGSESTSGGNCGPGDIGFVIERNQRAAVNWEDARLNCRLASLRLPEPFEFLYSCNNAGTFGLNNMTGDWEWASNGVIPLVGSVAAVVASALGEINCNSGSFGWVATNNEAPSSFTYRCVR